jgi:hypothetical protein
VNWHTVQVKLPRLLSHGRPLLLEVVHELALDLDSVGGFDGGAPGDVVGIDDASQVKK